MSRVGKLPIKIPQGIKISLDQLMLTISGPKGTLMRPVPEQLFLDVDQQLIQVRRRDDSRVTRSLHGLLRALVFNMVQGVSQGFTKTLEIQGTGYRADIQNNVLNLTLGYSHPINFTLPEGVKATVERQNVIRLEAIDKELLGETAARIRALRTVEPYKGKGIRYAAEKVHRKVGKAGSKK
jgi:large subunit ribosomal protein L6